jgi:hypothetical protein
MIIRSETTMRAIRNEANRTVSADEVRRYLETPISDTERQQVLDLVRWFRRRYPTAAERLAYVRKAYARWTLRATD